MRRRMEAERSIRSAMGNEDIQNLAKEFEPYLKDPMFLEVFDLVNRNSNGKIWLFGGYLYRNLIAALYGRKPYSYDIDFIVEERNEMLENVTGWNIKVNSYGVENYERMTNRTSITDIRKVVRVEGLKNFTIEEVITGTPLNIQSIAYDLQENRIIGQRGIEALRAKLIKVNNIAQAKFYAERKGKELKDIVIEKAEELGFDYKLPV